ncbi:MAG: HipA N-terminal domain-containing protein [Proteobacteria bacterium]|nr:HipA N-terminal domain-containing protein [Pseudomonadota bacterium]
MQRRGVAADLQMNLPEGYVLEQIRKRLAKAERLDPMLLLSLTGRDEPIGRVRVTGSDLLVASSKRVRLDKILHWQGADNLFDKLVATRSARGSRSCP